MMTAASVFLAGNVARRYSRKRFFLVRLVRIGSGLAIHKQHFQRRAHSVNLRKRKLESDAGQDRNMENNRDQYRDFQA